MPLTVPLPLPLILVPFEENEKDPSVWYVDHNYHENMCELYKKINGMLPLDGTSSGPLPLTILSPAISLFSQGTSCRLVPQWTQAACQ